MGGHAHIEIMEVLTTLDTILLTILVLIIVSIIICIAKWIRYKFVKCVRKEIVQVQEEMEAVRQKQSV